MLAAIDDRQVGYIETHGTGTPLGDAIEIEALRNVYAPRPQDQRCALGSVKSNMGHLDTAAGIAGLLKTVLAVSRGQIPPLLNFHTPNPALKLEESPLPYRCRHRHGRTKCAMRASPPLVLAAPTAI